jgi:hypothetical protein
MGDLWALTSPTRLTGVPQELDLGLMELFLQFFTAEELIERFSLTDLDTKELTILKAIVLQEMFRQIARSPVRDQVRTRFQQVYDSLRPPAAQTPPAP